MFKGQRRFETVHGILLAETAGENNIQLPLGELGPISPNGDGVLLLFISAEADFIIQSRAAFISENLKVVGIFFAAGFVANFLGLNFAYDDLKPKVL